MARHKEVTLVIHGPLSIYTVFTLYKYHREFPIIIVTPKTIPNRAESILKEIQRLVVDKEYQLSLFMYDETLPNDVFNIQNRYYHYLSVQIGLTACVTEYAIKIRSDEFYSDLVPFANAVTTLGRKIVTNDVFFRNTSMPYHISDHLVGGKTREMLETFRLAREFSENQEQRESNILIKYCRTAKVPALTAEQQLACAAITVPYSSSELEKLSVVDAMKERFFIVPCSDLGIYRIAYNSSPKDAPKEYVDDSYYNAATDVRDINDYK
jgi:hypothetical protein